MKTKKQVRRIVGLTALAALLVGAGLGAAASSGVQNVQAQLNANIAIKYDGETQTLLDAGGNRVYPLVYNGSTYLPVRAVSSLVGLAVDWDQASQTVLLGKQETRTDLIASLKPYTTVTNEAKPYYSTGAVQFIQSTDKLTKDIGGITLDHWFALYNRYATGEPAPNVEVTCSFNLEGKFNTLSFQAYSSKDTTLTLYGDNGNVLGQYMLKGGEVPQTYTVNLMGTRQLSFVRSPGMALGGKREENDIYCYVFNAYVE